MKECIFQYCLYQYAFEVVKLITRVGLHIIFEVLLHKIFTWTNWIVRADLPTPPPPTTITLYSVRSLDAAMILCVCVCVCV